MSCAHDYLVGSELHIRCNVLCTSWFRRDDYNIPGDQRHVSKVSSKISVISRNKVKINAYGVVECSVVTKAIPEKVVSNI